MRKRLLAIIATVAMVVAMVPSMVFAEGPDVAKIDDAGYESLQAAVNAAKNGDTIEVINNDNSTEKISIANKSLTIRGVGNSMPTIKAIFDIAHTDANGPYTVKFENLKFEPTKEASIITEESTNATSESNVNKLIINGCKMVVTVDTKVTEPKAEAAIAIKSNEGVTGAQLTFTNNTVETSGVGYYAAAISTSVEGASIYGTSIYNYGKHLIKDNVFSGDLYYVYVGGYADFVGNNVTLKAGRVLQIRGAKADHPKGGQLDVTVRNNVIIKANEVFKLYELDSLVGAEGVSFDLRGTGTNESENNTFFDVRNLGSADGTAAGYATLLVTEFVDKQWDEIDNQNLSITLSKVPLSKDGDVSLGKMTLADGKQVTTYTQVNPPTGYYYQNGDTKYWYFATLTGGTQHYFIDASGNFYIAKLVGGGEATSLEVAEGTQPSYESMVEGKLYDAGFTAATDSNSNTYYNATVSESESDDVITVSGEVDQINAFISNIGTCTSLFITDDSSVQAPNGALKLVVPGTSTNKMAQLRVSGSFPVIIDANISNVDIMNKCEVELNEGNTIGKLEIFEEKAIGSSFKNNGEVGSVYILAKTDVVNKGKITGTLSIADGRAGSVVGRLNSAKRAFDSTIVNEGKIESVFLGSKAKLDNGSETNKDAQIQGLVVGQSGINDDEGKMYGTGSEVVNYGKMCNENGTNHNISIYTKSAFNNKGVIGKEGRTPTGNHPPCDNVGGMIYIGYYGYNDAHDGLTFINSGTIYAGSRHNADSHQCFTLFLFGGPAGSSDSVSVGIYNESPDKGVIKGSVYRADYQSNLNDTIKDFDPSGKGEMKLAYWLADYTAVDKAIEKAEALNPDDYVDFSGVEAAINAVVRDKNFAEQNDVDAMAAAIEGAISELEKKPAGTDDVKDKDGSADTGDNSMAPFAVAGLVLAAMAAVVATRRREN